MKQINPSEWANSQPIIEQVTIEQQSQVQKVSKLQALKNKALRIILKDGKDEEEEGEEKDLEKLIKEIDLHTNTFLTHANYLNTATSILPGV